MCVGYIKVCCQFNTELTSNLAIHFILVFNIYAYIWNSLHHMFKSVKPMDSIRTMSSSNISMNQKQKLYYRLDDINNTYKV